MFKALNGHPPSYLSNLLIPKSSARSLRSADQFLLTKRRYNLERSGARAFAVAAPNLWNGIPLSIQLAPLVEAFKSRLKTYFYTLAFPDSGWICLESSLLPVMAWVQPVVYMFWVLSCLIRELWCLSTCGLFLWCQHECCDVLHECCDVLHVLPFSYPSLCSTFVDMCHVNVLCK